MTSSFDLDINDNVLAELRSASDIVAVIGDHTTLKKAGRSWKGLCPFHNERTPSFTVDRDKGLYHCFGCGAGGDVIHFVRQIDRLEFPEAVEVLASRFGVTIPRRQRSGPRDDRRDRLFEALSAAQRFFAERLARPGNAAAAYLESRGVPVPMWTTLGLGHAPDAWDSLGKALSPRVPGRPPDRGRPAPAALGGQGRVRPFPRPADLRRARRARARGGIRRARALARRRAQVLELARVARLLEEAAALRSLRGARVDPQARPRRARRGLLRPPRARARRHRGDGRVDGNRAHARAGGEAAPPLPAGDRLLRRRLRRPQRDARRPPAPARPGVRCPRRAAAGGRGSVRPACAARGRTPSRAPSTRPLPT